MSKVQIQRLPVHTETKRGFSHAWVPVSNGRVITNPNDEDGLFGSIKMAKKGAARALGCSPNDLKFEIMK